MDSGRTWRVVEHWTARGAPSAIYGTVIVGAVMVSGDEHTPIAEVTLNVVVTLVIYFAAERWSQALGTQVAGERLDGRRLRAVFADGLPMIGVSAAPLLVMVAASLAGADADLSVDIALGATVVLLIAFGGAAGRRAGLSGWALAAAAAVTGVLGAVLIVLKSLTD